MAFSLRKLSASAIWRSISRRPIATNAQVDNARAHTPVLLDETLEELRMCKGDTLLDMTFGAGGHSLAALKSTPDLKVRLGCKGKVLAVDRDPVAHRYARQLSESFPGQVTPILGKFSDVSSLLSEHSIGVNSIDGVLFDLGCSSMQFDYGVRGFAISKDGPLDMRMDPSIKLSAADIIAHASEDDLRRIFKYYGDENRSKAIAQAIVQARFSIQPIETTAQLAKLVEMVLGFSYRQDKLRRRAHVATKVFQALRIFVNNEINELNYGLLLAHRFLRPGGRLVAISFHSLEDRVVKRYIQGNIVDNAVSPLPLRYSSSALAFNDADMSDFRANRWESTTKHIVVPTEDEVFKNPRARSARLRAAIKIC